MKEVTIILTLPITQEPTDVNVVKHPPGPGHLLGRHVAVQAEVPKEIWDLLVAGDELDPIVQAAFELGRNAARGEYSAQTH